MDTALQRHGAHVLHHSLLVHHGNQQSVPVVTAAQGVSGASDILGSAVLEYDAYGQKASLVPDYTSFRLYSDKLQSHIAALALTLKMSYLRRHREASTSVVRTFQMSSLPASAARLLC